jgi:hypothetical protein
LRRGAGNRLPVAEDQRTIQREPAGTFRHIHTAAWDDGRRGGRRGNDAA